MRTKDHPLVGRRVRFVSSSDPYTRLRRGDEGTVTFVDDMDTVHICWDNGSTLGMIPRQDNFDILA